MQKKTGGPGEGPREGGAAQKMARSYAIRIARQGQLHPGTRVENTRNEIKRRRHRTTVNNERVAQPVPIEFKQIKVNK